jgi:hypothetical protein
MPALKKISAKYRDDIDKKTTSIHIERTLNVLIV